MAWNPITINAGPCPTCCSGGGPPFHFCEICGNTIVPGTRMYVTLVLNGCTDDPYLAALDGRTFFFDWVGGIHTYYDFDVTSELAPRNCATGVDVGFGSFDCDFGTIVNWTVRAFGDCACPPVAGSGTRYLYSAQARGSVCPAGGVPSATYVDCTNHSQVVVWDIKICRETASKCSGGFPPPTFTYDILCPNAQLVLSY